MISKGAKIPFCPRHWRAFGSGIFKACRGPLVVFYLFLLTICASLAENLPATSFTGSLSVFYNTQDTNSVPNKTANFTVTRANCAWSIQLTNIMVRNNQHQMSKDGALGVTIASDCQDLYRTTYWTLESFNAEKERELAKNPSRASAYETPRTESTHIFNGAYPRSAEPLEAALWLALCLPPHLQNGQTNLIPNVFNTMAWPTNQILCCASPDEDSGIVKDVLLWRPGHVMALHSKRTYKETPLPAPYTQGYVGFHHEFVPGAPGESRRFFKQSHSLVQLNMQDGSTHEDISVLVIGIVSNSFPSIAPSIITPSPQSIIVDKRTNISGRSVIYEAKSRGYLDPRDPQLKSKVKVLNNEVRILAGTNDGSIASRWNPWSALILATLLALPIYFLAKKQKNRL